MSNVQANIVQDTQLEADGLDWKEVKELGLEPAPADMEEDDGEASEA